MLFVSEFDRGIYDYVIATDEASVPRGEPYEAAMNPCGYQVAM